MDTVLAQLEDPLGAAVTLSKLLSSNEVLMHRYANAELVLRFVAMIRQLGPQPRLVNFFEAMCTVEGRPVKANQEMILRLTWMNEGNRAASFLTTRGFDAAKAAAMTPPPAALPSVREPSGTMTDGRVTAAAAAGFPPDYIGKAKAEAAVAAAAAKGSAGGFFPAMFVQWSGADGWGPGMDDALFHSPTALGLPLYDTGGGGAAGGGRPEDRWVRLEDLAWVLDAPRLCEAITGRPWADVDAELAKDPAAAKKFTAKTQLADYYCGQLALHAKMCFGRS